MGNRARVRATERRHREAIFWAKLAAVASAIAIPVAIVLAATSGSDSPRNASPPGGEAGRVDVEYRVVRNGRPSFENDREALRTAPSVDLVVRSSGPGNALIIGAQVTIEDYAVLTPCVTTGAGDLPVSFPFEVKLPPYPLPFAPSAPQRQLPLAYVPKQITPGTSERLTFRFRGPSYLVDYQVYALRIALTTRNPTGAVDAGQFILGVPGPIDPVFAGHYLPDGPSVLTQAGFEDGPYYAIIWCFKRNLAELQRVLARPGLRATAIRDLAHPTLSDNWQRVATRSGPARASATRLLADQTVKNGRGPLLAVFAATQTRDKAFLARTRIAAAQALVTRAQRNLKDENAGGLRLLEQDMLLSLSLNTSSEAQRTLKEIRRRLALSPEP